MNTVELLQQLKDILMDYGWCQGDFQDGKGRLCLRGAVGVLYQTIPGHTVLQLLNALTKQTGPGLGIISWNDAHGRTFNEVIDLIDTTILAEKEAGAMRAEGIDTLNETPEHPLGKNG